MAATTDFNVAPYWDTFNIDNDFYRVLFRPGICSTSPRINNTTNNSSKSN